MSKSSSSNTSTQSSGGSGAFASTLQADTQMAQLQAATQQQQIQSQSQLAAAQLAAQVQAQQVNASVQTNNVNTAATLAATLAGISSQTAQAANTAVSNQNIYGMQEAVLADQINSGVVEQANNNATALAASQIQTNAQQAIASQTIAGATALAQQQQSNFQQNVSSIIPLAGQQKNSALDATNQTALFQTILANGNPGVASSGNAATATSAVSGNNQGNIAAITSGASSAFNGVMTGLFG